MRIQKQWLLAAALAVVMPAAAVEPVPGQPLPDTTAGDAQAKTPATRLPLEDLRAFVEVFERIRASYVEPVDDRTLFENAIRGMLSSLDPHSAYLDEKGFEDLQNTTSGEFGGLGIEVGMEDGFVKVVSPIEDTPAFRAGVKAGDLIIKLDDTSTKGLNLSDAVKRMRGKPNTSIRLTIDRITCPDQSAIFGSFVVEKQHPCGKSTIGPGDFLPLVEGTGEAVPAGNDQAKRAVGFANVDPLNIKGLHLLRMIGGDQHTGHTGCQHGGLWQLQRRNTACSRCSNLWPNQHGGWQRAERCFSGPRP